MRIGIVEIMETGHITFAETLCRIYCSDPVNQVFLFTLKRHAVNIEFLKDLYPNLEIVIKEQDKELKAFLDETGDRKPDRIYLVTLIKHFRLISGWNTGARLFLTIHNTDDWSGITFYNSIRKFISSVTTRSGIALWMYYFKVSFVYPPYKKRILAKVKESGGKLVVLSEVLKKQLNSLSPGMPTEVIPFSVFDPKLAKTATPSEMRLRICVPGMLSQYRRDYKGLLDLIENKLDKYRDYFIFDLLGGIPDGNPADNPSFILSRVEVLKKKGFAFIIHNFSFIPPLEYDRELAKADIILGNMNVTLTRFSEYGRTKETGIPFAMIRAAKPGIVPASYQIAEELRSSTIFYQDNEDLAGILEDVISDRKKVEELQTKALVNSGKFTPESVYRKLEGKDHI